jgi:hypothetical protein
MDWALLCGECADDQDTIVKDGVERHALYNITGAWLKPTRRRIADDNGQNGEQGQAERETGAARVCSLRLVLS